MPFFSDLLLTSTVDDPCSPENTLGWLCVLGICLETHTCLRQAIADRQHRRTESLPRRLLLSSQRLVIPIQSMTSSWIQLDIRIETQLLCFTIACNINSIDILIDSCVKNLTTSWAWYTNHIGWHELQSKACNSIFLEYLGQVWPHWTRIYTKIRGYQSFEIEPRKDRGEIRGSSNSDNWDHDRHLERTVLDLVDQCHVTPDITS